MFKMKTPWLLWLALRELRSWRLRSLLSLIALALSVGLVVATTHIGAAMRASVATPAPLLGRPAGGSTMSTDTLADLLWVSSAYDADYDLPARLQAQIERVPGVAAVQPVLRRPVRVHTPRPDALTLMGVNLAAYFPFHDLGLAAGSLPSADNPGLVALAPWAFVRDIDLGQSVTVTTSSGDVALPVVGLVEVESLVAARQGLVLYAPRDTVADLFALHDAVTAFEVRLAPGATPRRVRADLEQALGSPYVVSVASRLGQRAQLWQRLVLGALVFVDVLTLAGSASLVYAVFAAAARARRRQIGLLRVVGALRRQILALLVTEAALLGLAGSALGLLVGLLFARVGVGLVLQSAPRFGPPAARVAAPAGALPISSLLLAVALGVLGALVGAVGPALRAARRSPLAALHVLPPQPSQHAGRGWLGQSLRCSLPPETRLAVASLARQRRSATRIVAALALILAMALGDVGVLSLLGHEMASTFGRLTGGDFLVLPSLTTISLRELAGQDTSDVPPLAPGLLAALEDLRGQVRLMRGTTADVEPLQVFPGQPTLLLDVESYAQMGGFRFQAGDWSTALDAFRRGPAVLLTPVVARRLGVGLGDPVQLDTLQGPADFAVAGIGDSEFTTCVLDLADGAAFLGANEINGVEVQVRPGADPQAVQRALLDAVQTHGGTLLSLGQALGQLQEVFRRIRLSIGLLIGVTALVAGLGVVNAMLASVAQRRREIGLLRAVGATRLQIRRLIRTEAAVLGAAAALIGTALGWAITFLSLILARAYLGLAGEGAASLAAWLPLIGASLASFALWPLLAAVAALIPATQAARLPVIQALYEAAPA